MTYVLVLLTWWFTGGYEETVVASFSNEASCVAQKHAEEARPDHGSSFEYFCIETRYYRKE